MSSSNDLLHGKISTVLFRQSYPMALGIIFMIVVNLIDTYWASQLGTDELAAMSFCFPVIGIIINVSIGLMIGTSVAIARIIGAGEQERAKKISTHALYLGLMVVIAVSSIGLLSQEALFRMLGAPEHLLQIKNPDGSTEKGLLLSYMTIWYLGSIVLMVPMMINGVLRAKGDAKTPMNVMMLGAIGNAIFDPIFIFGLGPIPALHLEGAAYATVLSRVIGFLYAGYVMVFREKMLDLHLPKVDEFLESSRIILRVGIPATVTNVLGPIATAALTAIVATYGSAAVAAYGIGARVEALVLIAPGALSSGLSPFVGQNWGAHLEDRVAKGFKLSIQFCIVWGLVALLVLLISADHIAAFFSQEEAVQRDIALYLRVVPIGYAAYSVMIIVNSTFNAMDHAIRSSILSVLRSIVFAIPAALIGSYFLELEGVFLGLVIGSFLACLLGLRWMRSLLRTDPQVEIDKAKPTDKEAVFLIEKAPEALREKMRLLIAECIELEAVELHQIRLDAVGFFVGRRQLGHIHPSGHIDLPLPQEIGLYLVDQGLIEHHRLHDGNGWFTHKLESEQDVNIAKWLIKLNHLLYEIKTRGLEDPITQKEFAAVEVCEVGRAVLQKCVGRWECAS